MRRQFGATYGGYVAARCGGGCERSGGTYDFPGDNNPEYPTSITKGQAEQCSSLPTPDAR